MKNKDLKPGLPYPSSLSFKLDGEIKNFQDKKQTNKQKAKGNYTTTSAL